MNEKDILVRAMLNGEAAVCACDVSRMAELARLTHDASPIASIILGRTLAASAMMASALKDEGEKLSITINGGGPAGTIMAVAGADLKVKAYVANPAVDMPPASEGGFDVKGAVGNKGFLTVVRDTGRGEPYIGKVRLATGGIGEDVARYYLVSEQQPSIVYVNTWLETDRTVLNAGGVMIRPMPGCSEQTLSEIEQRIGQIANYAVYLIQYGVKDVLNKIFEGMELKFLDEATPVYECDCSRERLEQVVISLGEEEIKDMIKKQNGAQVTCHFCNRIYEFSADELTGLLKQAISKKDGE